jgi:WD40 repeat protein
MIERRESGRRLFFKWAAGIGIAVVVLAFAGTRVMEWARERLADVALAGMWFGGGGLQVRSLAFSPDGQKLAVGYSFPPLTCVWDVQSGSQLMVIEEKEHEAIEHVTYSPDGRLLAVGIEKLSDFGTEGSYIRIRDAQTGNLMRELEIPAWAQFDPAAELLVAGDAVRKWPEATVLREFRWPDNFWSGGLGLSTDGALLALGGSFDNVHSHPNTIAIVCDVHSGRLVKSLECPDDLPHKTCAEGKDIDFHPNGRRLAIGTIDDAFHIWDVETDEVETFRREGGRWWAVDFSPDGRLLAASGAGGMVLIWDVANGKEVAALKGHVLSVYGLEFSPKGELLASGGMDGTVRLWGPKGWGRKKWGLVRTLKLEQPGE